MPRDFSDPIIQKLRFAHELRAKVRARGCLLWAQTAEEYRLETTVSKVMAEIRVREGADESAVPYNCWVWRITTGLYDLEQPDERDMTTRDPNKLLDRLRNWSNGPSMIICEDIGAWLSTPQMIRGFRDIVRDKIEGPYKEYVQILVVDREPPLPGFVRIDLELPIREELRKILDTVLEEMPKVQKCLDDDKLQDTILDCLVGLEADQAAQAIAESVIMHGRLDPDAIIRSKKDLMASSGSLQWIEPVKDGLDGVGGLDRLKRWLVKRQKAFSQEARTWGLPKPKGILLCGVPGVGKSHSAKAISAVWGVPCLRFDVSAACDKFVGGSEKGLRDALAKADAISPCVLWIDELEKAFAGAGSAGDSDGGTTVRVFGIFLTWLQETDSHVFVMATANDVTKLPPELFRAGRFDAIWWLDVPNLVDRRKVLDVLIRKRPRLEGIDRDAIAAVTQGYTPAEIEQATIEALYKAFDEDSEVTTETVLDMLKDITPITESWGAKITLLRAWARTSARLANEPDDIPADPDGDPTATKVAVQPLWAGVADDPTKNSN